ncbi:uncharacterized protein LOC102805167 [Saccoglossus kowalevskii]
MNYKNHRNGIKRPKSHRYPSLKGVDQKFLKKHEVCKETQCTPSTAGQERINPDRIYC